MVKWTAKLWMVANRNNWLFLVCVCLSFRFGLPPLSLSRLLILSFERKSLKKKKQFITQAHYLLFHLIIK